MGGQCMTNQFSVDSKASFFAIFGGQFLDLQNAMKFGDVSKVLPSFLWFDLPCIPNQTCLSVGNTCSLQDRNADFVTVNNLIVRQPPFCNDVTCGSTVHKPPTVKVRSSCRSP